MAVVKRGKTWHTHFFVEGQRYRQSLETKRLARSPAEGKGAHSPGVSGKACACVSAVLQADF